MNHVHMEELIDISVKGKLSTVQVTILSIKLLVSTLQNFLQPKNKENDWTKQSTASSLKLYR